MTDADEEAREYLQERLAIVFKLMFWSLVGLLVFVATQYAIHRELAPQHLGGVYVISGVGLTAMAIIWRGLLVRGPLSLGALRRIDLIYVVGIGAAFAASAVGQAELPPAAYMALVWSTFSVFARALVVPSSALRTAILSTLAFVPMSAAALLLALYTTQELPSRAFFFGYLLLSVVPIVLATAGSHIIYGLNRQVSAALHLGQYTLDRKLGEGGMSTVYVARHLLLRRPTAVKILPPDRNRADELERFEREVRSMSKLSHPNTVAVFDYGHSADGGLYYAMEYLAPGIDLHALVHAHGPQPVARIASILAQVCGALEEAHGLGIVHRDVKPGNIILCERGGVPDVAKIVDFGIAKQLGDDVASTLGVVFGTPGYLAPEVLTGGAIGPAADLYALGAVGYFLLTGRRVFEGTAAEICAQHASAAPVPPSQVAAIFVAPELEAVIMRCLARQRMDRYASAAELADALRALPGADWSEAHARAWWLDFKRGEAAAPPPATIDTITIDLGERVRIA